MLEAGGNLPSESEVLYNLVISQRNQSEFFLQIPGLFTDLQHSCYDWRFHGEPTNLHVIKNALVTKILIEGSRREILAQWSGRIDCQK